MGYSDDYFNDMLERRAIKSERRRKQTLAQQKAGARNWQIRQLRAFFHMIPPPMSEGSRKKIQAIVDGEIRLLGAESEIKRERERHEDQSTGNP